MRREQVSIRLKPDIKHAVEAMAKRENRSLSQTIETLLEMLLQPKKPDEGSDASQGVEQYLTPGEPIGKYPPIIAPKAAEKLEKEFKEMGFVPGAVYEIATPNVTTDIDADIHGVAALEKMLKEEGHAV